MPRRPYPPLPRRPVTLLVAKRVVERAAVGACAASCECTQPCMCMCAPVACVRCTRCAIIRMRSCARVWRARRDCVCGARGMRPRLLLQRPQAGSGRFLCSGSASARANCWCERSVHVAASFSVSPRDRLPRILRHEDPRPPWEALCVQILQTGYKPLHVRNRKETKGTALV